MQRQQLEAVSFLHLIINKGFVQVFFFRHFQVVHDEGGFLHDGFVSKDAATNAHGDGDGIRRPRVNHSDVVALLTNQHGVIHPFAETVDNHFLDFDVELPGKSQKEVVGEGTSARLLVDAYCDGFGFGIPDDDRQLALRVLVAQYQHACSCGGLAVCQADDFQTDLVHFC